MTLDLRAVSSTGGTSLTSIATVLLGGDGQTVAGVPVTTNPPATLIGWGGMTTIADTIKEIQMQSLDQLDDINVEDFTPGASSLIGYQHFWDNLPYRTAARVLKMAQNTGAANNIGYYMDLYPITTGQAGQVIAQSLGRFGPTAATWIGSTTYGGALTAVTWKQQALAPTTVMPAGRYAILGAKVNALTNYGLLRFRHADFGTFAPGIPVLDMTNTAAANAVLPKDPFFLHEGNQFVYLSEILQQPMCPVFTVTAQGTGLQFEMAAITADTPIVTLNLRKVG
jgi:hypothetical protein